MNKKIIQPEIVSPAGNLEKLKFAVKYGADAVYLGGDEFNLRIKSGNFSHEEIREAVSFCREHGVRIIFLLNSFLHENDIEDAKKYISQIRDYDFDALMVSDPGMMILIKEAGLKHDIHLSTQMSTLNHLSIKFWNEAGFKRIVLGRETTIDEIKKIRKFTDADIEVFIHGALCIAYSGRCLLSRYLTGRDANNGDCAQPCRWNYTLIEKMRPGNYMDIVEHATGTEIISSKDLCLLEKVPEYIEAGVNAFKIEGRMKSLYHSANTTRIYKHAVQLSGTESFNEMLPFWKEELDLINHRPYTDDLFNEFDDLKFTEIPYIKKALFLGYKESNGDNENEYAVKTFNPIFLNEKIDAILPITETIKDKKLTVVSIKDRDGNPVDMARPGAIYYIEFSDIVDDDAIFRRRLL